MSGTLTIDQAGLSFYIKRGATNKKLDVQVNREGDILLKTQLPLNFPLCLSHQKAIAKVTKTALTAEDWTDISDELSAWLNAAVESTTKAVLQYSDDKRVAIRIRPKSGEAYFAIRNLLTGDISTAPSIEVNGNLIVPLDAKDVEIGINSPNALVTYPHADLSFALDAIKKTLRKALILDDSSANGLALYGLWTVFSAKCNYAPLLRSSSPLGRAKTRLAMSFARVIPNSFLAADPTFSGLKRLIRSLHPNLVVVDEGDEQQSDEAASITKLYNVGTTRGTLLIEGNKETQSGDGDFLTSDVFCPKAVFSRRPFKDEALESKALQLVLPAKTLEAVLNQGYSVRLHENSEFWTEAQDVTNLLAAAFLKFYPEVVDKPFDWTGELDKVEELLPKNNPTLDVVGFRDFVLQHIEPRLVQTFDPLLMLNEHLPHATFDMLTMFLQNAKANIERMAASPDGLVAKSYLNLIAVDTTFADGLDTAKTVYEIKGRKWAYSKAIYADLEQSMKSQKVNDAFEKLGLEAKRIRVSVKNSIGESVERLRPLVSHRDDSALAELKRKYDFEAQALAIDGYLAGLEAVRLVRALSPKPVCSINLFQASSPENPQIKNVTSTFLPEVAYQAYQNDQNPQIKNVSGVLLAKVASKAYHEQEVRFLVDCPEFVSNSDMSTLGAFQAGQVVTLPKEDAELLVSRNLVVLHASSITSSNGGGTPSPSLGDPAGQL